MIYTRLTPNWSISNTLKFLLIRCRKMGRFEKPIAACGCKRLCRKVEVNVEIEFHKETNLGQAATLAAL